MSKYTIQKYTPPTEVLPSILKDSSRDGHPSHLPYSPNYQLEELKEGISKAFNYQLEELLRQTRKQINRFFYGAMITVLVGVAAMGYPLYQIHKSIVELKECVTKISSTYTAEMVSITQEYSQNIEKKITEVQKSAAEIKLISKQLVEILNDIELKRTQETVDVPTSTQLEEIIEDKN